MDKREYIEREAARKFVCYHCIGEFCDKNGRCKAITELDAIPAADVVEVRHGRWVPGREISRTMLIDETIAIEYEDWHCSECGVVVEDWEYPRYKFCPHCGAKMDGGADNA